MMISEEVRLCYGFGKGERMRGCGFERLAFMER